MKNLPAKYEGPQTPDSHAAFYGAGEYSSVQASGVDAQRYFGFVLRYWWVLALTLALALAAAASYVMYAPPTYSSEAKMWETEKMRLPGESFTEDLQDYITTQITLLKSSKMEQLALQRLRAKGTPVPLVTEKRLTKK